MGTDYFLLRVRNLVQRQGAGFGCKRCIGCTGQQKCRALHFLLPILVGPERIFGRAGWIRMGAFSWVRRADVFVALFGDESGEISMASFLFCIPQGKYCRKKYWTIHQCACSLKDRGPLLCPMRGSKRDLYGKYSIRGIWFQHFWARGRRCRFSIKIGSNHFVFFAACKKWGGSRMCFVFCWLALLFA